MLWNICLDHLSICRFVGPSVGLSVCKVYCGKMAACIRMPFGMVSAVDRGMVVLDGDGYRRMGKGSFGGEFGASHCKQWGFCCVVVHKCVN